MNTMATISHLPKWTHLLKKLLKDEQLLSEYSEIRSLLIMLCIFGTIEQDKNRNLTTFCQNHKIWSIIWAISDQWKIQWLNKISIWNFESENDLLIMIENSSSIDELIDFIGKHYLFFDANVQELIEQFNKSWETIYSKDFLTNELNQKLWNFRKNFSKTNSKGVIDTSHLLDTSDVIKILRK